MCVLTNLRKRRTSLKTVVAFIVPLALLVVLFCLPIQREARPIPRVLHQVWINGTLPSWSEVCVSSWRKKNPAWRFEVWDHARVTQLIRDKFPAVWTIWPQLNTVERVDAFKYAVVYQFGGVYADIDVFCYRALHEWPSMNARRARAIVGVEATLRNHEERKHAGFAALTQYCTWVFAAPPRHWLPKLALDVLVRRVSASTSKSSTIERTGPGAFTQALNIGLAARKRAVADTGVTVLSGDAFAVGGYSNTAYPTNRTLALHGFRGDWKHDSAPKTDACTRFAWHSLL